MMKLQQDILFADRYRLIKRIGQGGFAEVWLADDTLADLQVAIKIYGGMDEDGLKIFVKEINKVYYLNHTNLLKPQYVAAWNNMPYLVMTYCSAGSLEKKIGQITEQEAWKILHDVASGLAYLHSNNIIHQDIKPANILQDNMGNYVIIDFGISTLARDTLRKSTLWGNTSAGTLAYMGPERFSKDSAPIFASDIWSLGAMLFELLEGKTPFPADFGGGMQKAGAELPDISANVSNELKLVISKMLSLSTWDRPTADTLVEWTNNQDKRYIVVDAKIQGYIDLGLPSGTLWKKTNEGGDNAHYTNSEAVSQFGNRLPTKQQLAELYDECEWIWDVNGCKVIGPSGKFIWLPAAGSNGCEEKMRLQGVGKSGHYWSAPYDSDTSCPWCISFDSKKRKVSLHDIYKSFYLSVRLVDCAKNLPSIENSTLPTSKGLWEHVQQSQQSKQPKSKAWIWIMVALLIIAGLGMIGIRKYQDHQLDIAIEHPIPRENIRQVQIQDSIREVRRQDSIRIEQERICRQDSISAAQAAEQERLLHLQKEKEERQRKENERKRLEQSVVEKDPYNGHSYVDLGLSVKWATCNVGANTPEAYGDYFAWGETKPKVVYGEKIYKYNEGVEKTITKYNFSAAHGAVDNKYVLDLEDDAAHINWGGKWRMPTRKECAELEEICTWQWKQYNGVKGYLVTGPNGNSIFLPAAGFKKEKAILEVGIRGFYLSNTLMKAKTDYHTYSPYVLIAKWENESKYWWGRSRYYGIPVRPVCK